MHTKSQTSLSPYTVLPRCGRPDLRDQQVPHRQADHQGPVHHRLRWPARCHRLLPWLPAGQGSLCHEGDVPHRHHHRHLLHRLRSGTSAFRFEQTVDGEKVLISPASRALALRYHQRNQCTMQRDSCV